jgi:hypothetical protein
MVDSRLDHPHHEKIWIANGKWLSQKVMIYLPLAFATGMCCFIELLI